jgi:hypothetical protein
VLLTHGFELQDLGDFRNWTKGETWASAAILFWHSLQLASGRYSHAALVVHDDQVLEAVKVDGVNPIPLKDWFQRHKDRGIVILRSPDYHDIDYYDLTLACRRHEFKPYSLGGLVIGSAHEGPYYCSKLVFDILTQAGIITLTEGLTRRYSSISPGELFDLLSRMEWEQIDIADYDTGQHSRASGPNFTELLLTSEFKHASGNASLIRQVAEVSRLRFELSGPDPVRRLYFISQSGDAITYALSSVEALASWYSDLDQPRVDSWAVDRIYAQRRRDETPHYEDFWKQTLADIQDIASAICHIWDETRASVDEGFELNRLSVRQRVKARYMVVLKWWAMVEYVLSWDFASFSDRISRWQAEADSLRSRLSGLTRSRCEYLGFLLERLENCVKMGTLTFEADQKFLRSLHGGEDLFLRHLASFRETDRSFIFP